MSTITSRNGAYRVLGSVHIFVRSPPSPLPPIPPPCRRGHGLGGRQLAEPHAGLRQRSQCRWPNAPSLLLTSDASSDRDPDRGARHLRGDGSDTPARMRARTNTDTDTHTHPWHHPVRLCTRASLNAFRVVLSHRHCNRINLRLPGADGWIQGVPARGRAEPGKARWATKRSR